MNLNFIGVNEKIVNLDAIALIEDQSEEGKSVAILTTLSGIELTLENEDADALFQRAELMMQATDALLAKMRFAEDGGLAP